jgi:cytochrome c
MKKTILLSFLMLVMLALTASSQTTKPTESVPVFSIADSATFTGKYKYEGLPFDYMEISVKDGKLYYSGGEYSGFLEPLKEKKDAFDASGEAVFTFVRNSDNKVTELRIDYQGQTYSGQRDLPKS